VGQTIVEKILSKKYGASVFAGDEKIFSPDIITAYDFPGYVDKYEEQMNELGITQVQNPEKYVLFIDHFYPAGTPKQQQVHEITRRFAKNYGFSLYEGKGIGHQVISELGYVKPGRLIVHFDGHISTIGALGAMGIGIRNGMIEAFATQKMSLVVPGTVRIELKGKLERGVTSRDVFHSIVEKIGPAGCRSSMIEYGGEGLKSLNMDERMTLCNLAMFLGGVSAVMETDETTYNYLYNHGVADEYQDIYPDSDATYKKTVTINLNEVEPVVVAPPSPANTVKISEVLGTPIQVGYIGSCASGRVKDFQQAVEILGDHQILDGFRLYAVPTSNKIQSEMTKLGLSQKLIDAGALLSFPSCDFCIGQMGALVEGENAMTTGTLNIPGRMGSNKASIYTGSPYSIAAAAITGKITDPRTLF